MRAPRGALGAPLTALMLLLVLELLGTPFAIGQASKTRSFKEWSGGGSLALPARNHAKEQERNSAACKAVLTGLVVLGLLACSTRGCSPSSGPRIYDYHSIPGGGASEWHHRHFVSAVPNYGSCGASPLSPPAPPPAGPPPPDTPYEFPSGMWYGYFNHGSPVPNPFAICLHFMQGRITDVGEDAIGQFQISGVYSLQTRRVAFSKQYIWGTGNVLRNEGQLLEYRGARAPQLGQGLRGTWHMRTSWMRVDGNFHIWPVMPHWNPHSPRFIPLPPCPRPPATRPPAARVVKVRKRLYIAEGQHCCLCVRRPITAMAVPCGHVAFCLQCIRELCLSCTAFCPLCQRGIAQIHTEAFGAPPGRPPGPVGPGRPPVPRRLPARRLEPHPPFL